MEHDLVSLELVELGTCIEEHGEADQIVCGSRRVAHVVDSSVFAQLELSLLMDAGVVAGGREEMEGFDLSDFVEDLSVEDHMFGGGGVEKQFTSTRVMDHSQHFVLLCGIREL